MTDTTLSAAIKEAYASAPSNEVIIHTLEFRHPLFVDEFSAPTAIRVVQGYEKVTATLESTAPLNPSTAVLFLGVPFQFTLPEITTSPSPELLITLDNVTGEIEANLALAVVSPYKIEVTYRPYLLSNLTVPQMNPPLTLTIISVEANDFQVTARAGFSEFLW